MLETNLDAGGGRRNYLFADPVEEITAADPEEAVRAFKRIEEGVAAGLHAAGFFSYELGYCLEDSLKQLIGGRVGRVIDVGLYEAPLVFDADRASGLSGACGGFHVSEFTLSETFPAYEKKIAEIKRGIEAGETYQINYTFKVDFQFSGDPAGLYLALREKQPTSYSAILRSGGEWVLSLSPELFFRIEGDRIETRPMKGTVRRGADPEEDSRLAEFLASDEKNRAENLMIVDLIRNDLGRVAVEGSVVAPSLFVVEKYETLYQMTSEVRARLSPGVGVEEIFRSIFPSGSVTGAPKISSMKIIGALENGPRGVYTGAIGFIAPRRERAVFNIAIRTLAVSGGRGEMGVGGGIVYDSQPESEWDEALLKARFLTSCASSTAAAAFSLIETLLWSAGEGFFLLELHLQRMSGSAAGFGISFDANEAVAALASAVEELSPEEGPRRVRLLLGADGRYSAESREFKPLAGGQRFEVSPKTVLSSGPFLRHKTTVRNFYDREHAAAAARGLFDIVFMNERGEITEGAISNILVLMDGELLTPPVECGLLPGVYRRHLLETGEAMESKLTPADLERAEKIYLCNSVRGMVEVTAGGSRGRF